MFNPFCLADCNHKTTSWPENPFPRHRRGNAAIGRLASLTLGCWFRQPRACLAMLDLAVVIKRPTHTVTKGNKMARKSPFSPFYLVWSYCVRWSRILSPLLSSPLHCSSLLSSPLLSHVLLSTILVRPLFLISHICLQDFQTSTSMSVYRSVSVFVTLSVCCVQLWLHVELHELSHHLCKPRFRDRRSTHSHLCLRPAAPGHISCCYWNIPESLSKLLAVVLHCGTVCTGFS